MNSVTKRGRGKLRATVIYKQAFYRQNIAMKSNNIDYRLSAKKSFAINSLKRYLLFVNL